MSLVEVEPDARTDEHPTEAVETLAPGTALLVVQRGPNAGGAGFKFAVLY